MRNGGIKSDRVGLGPIPQFNVCADSELCAPTKAEYICADHPVTFIFCLRQSGGPYIPVCHYPGRNGDRLRRAAGLNNHLAAAIYLLSFSFLSTSSTPLRISL